MPTRPACLQVRSSEHPEAARLPLQAGCPSDFQKLVWDCTHYNRRSRWVKTHTAARLHRLLLAPSCGTLWRLPCPGLRWRHGPGLPAPSRAQRSPTQTARASTAVQALCGRGRPAHGGNAAVHVMTWHGRARPHSLCARRPGPRAAVCTQRQCKLAKTTNLMGLPHPLISINVSRTLPLLFHFLPPTCCCHSPPPNNTCRITFPMNRQSLSHLIC